MFHAKEHYLDILRIELEDLREDIENMIEEYDRDRRMEKITNYVCWHNTTVLKNELLCLNELQKIIQETQPEKYPNLNELIGHLRGDFHYAIQHKGFWEAVTGFVDRKIQKVQSYVIHH